MPGQGCDAAHTAMRHAVATMADLDAEKRAAAQAAAELVQPGDLVGLGTGSTVAHLLSALAARGLEGVRCVATSPATERMAAELGLAVEPFDDLDRLDIAIDGTDQVTPEHWLIKGGGGAQTREKVVAAAAERFVVIASSDKTVAALEPPVPLELLAYGLRATLRELGDATLREQAPASPDAGVIADYHGSITEPAALAAWLDSVPGVVSHGLFAPELVSAVLVADGESVRAL